MSDRKLEQMTREECLGKLAAGSVGRLAVVDGDAPDMLPVNYAYTDDGIVVHTDPGTKLEAGSRAKVAFEIDEIDEAERTGWSVVVRGHAYDVSETLDDRSERLRAAAVESWAPGPKARTMRVQVDSVSGRRLAKA